MFPKYGTKFATQKNLGNMEHMKNLIVCRVIYKKRSNMLSLYEIIVRS